jgi:hypothetical protein
VLKKIFYFSDIKLLLEIIRLQRVVGRGGGRDAIALLEQPARPFTKPLDREKIDRYVNLGLRIGALFGLLNSCLPRSVIRCMLLRRSGVCARVAFGLSKDREVLIGHCWVVEDEAPQVPAENAAYQDIQLFPGSCV